MKKKVSFFILLSLLVAVVGILVLFAVSGQTGRNHLQGILSGDIAAIRFHAYGETLELTDEKELQALVSRMAEFQVSRLVSKATAQKTGALSMGIDVTYTDGSTRSISIPYFEVNGVFYQATYQGEPAYIRQIFPDKSMWPARWS